METRPLREMLPPCHAKTGKEPCDSEKDFKGLKSLKILLIRFQYDMPEQVQSVQVIGLTGHLGGKDPKYTPQVMCLCVEG